MCGLVGMAGDVDSTKHNKMFKDMLLLDVVRGGDSTGVAMIPSSGFLGIQIEKELGPPSNLWDWNESKLFSIKGQLIPRARCLIGHNRAATFGKITVANAHPFQYDHIIGAHNGTLDDWRDLEGYLDNDVDSMSLFLTIAKKGIDHCWKSFLGAAAITFWNDKDKTINLIRNEERPLWICMSKDEKSLFWASEPWMISIPAMRVGVDLKKDEKGMNDIFQLKEHALHTFEVDERSVSLKEVRELEKKVLPKVTKVGKTGFTHGKDYKKVEQKQTTKINYAWAKNLEKAPKEVRGTHLILDYAIRPYHSEDTRMWYVVGKIISDGPFKNKRVEIMPNTVGEWYNLQKLCDDKKSVWKISECPRIAPSTTNHRFVSYRVSSKSIDFSHAIIDPSNLKDEGNSVILFPNSPKKGKKDERKFVGPNGVYIPEWSWWEELEKRSKDLGCTGCGDPLDVEDHHELLWTTHSVFCCACQKDENLMTYAYSYC